jgi:multidrug efflux pump subunit AcrA (membrane-fusion protein)
MKIMQHNSQNEPLEAYRDLIAEKKLIASLWAKWGRTPPSIWMLALYFAGCLHPFRDILDQYLDGGKNNRWPMRLWLARQIAIAIRIKRWWRQPTLANRTPTVTSWTPSEATRIYAPPVYRRRDVRWTGRIGESSNLTLLARGAVLGFVISALVSWAFWSWLKKEHPDTLIAMLNLDGTLKARGDIELNDKYKSESHAETARAEAERKQVESRKLQEQAQKSQDAARAEIAEARRMAGARDTVYNTESGFVRTGEANIANTGNNLPGLGQSSVSGGFKPPETPGPVMKLKDLFQSQNGWKDENDFWVREETAFMKANQFRHTFDVLRIKKNLGRREKPQWRVYTGEDDYIESILDDTNLAVRQRVGGKETEWQRKPHRAGQKDIYRLELTVSSDRIVEKVGQAIFEFPGTSDGRTGFIGRFGLRLVN